MPPSILVDPTDAAVLSEHRWWVKSKTTPSGRVYRYAEAKMDGKKVLLHRFLLRADAREVVDHVNGDGLDNRRENLRKCTHAENMRNRRINMAHPTGFKGVGCRADGSFYAQIRAGDVRRFAGGFATPQEAAEAYARMAAELHGGFARCSSSLSQ